MKHIFIIETADPMSKVSVDLLREKIQDAAGLVIGEPNYMMHSCNTVSAIRGVYRLFSADESFSPNELGSAL